MDEKYKALVVDDESNCRENLKMLLDEFCPEVEVIGLADSGQEAREIIENETPDMVFLDIMMPGEDGFKLLRSLENRDFALVFTTAHNEYALRAIKESAVDYLEKPININELKEAVSRAISRIGKRQTEGTSGGNIELMLQELSNHHSVEKTAIPTRDGLAIVKNNEIIHLEADESYTTIFLTEGRKYLSSKTIKVYEDHLNPNMFFRTHKSHIINMAHHLKEFSRADGNVAIMSNNAAVPISRRKLTPFLEKISTF
jgi:two-component system LytT family response regulator